MWTKPFFELLRTCNRTKPKGPTRNCNNISLLLEQLEDRLAPAAYFWTSANKTSAWIDPANWSVEIGGMLVAAKTQPGVNDDVTFDNSKIVDGGQTISITGGIGYSGTIESLTILKYFTGTLRGWR